MMSWLFSSDGEQSILTFYLADQMLRRGYLIAQTLQYWLSKLNFQIDACCKSIAWKNSIHNPYILLGGKGRWREYTHTTYKSHWLKLWILHQREVSCLLIPSSGCAGKATYSVCVKSVLFRGRKHKNPPSEKMSSSPHTWCLYTLQFPHGSIPQVFLPRPHPLNSRLPITIQTSSVRSSNLERRFDSSG